MGRRIGTRWRLRIAALLLLAGLVATGAAWWHLRHWTPPRATWPMQGVEVGTIEGSVDWTALKAVGADFAYLDASASAFARDPGFVKNLEAARAARLQVGAVHLYDPCQPVKIDRNLWLTGERFEPDYAGRPWMLWTANTHLVTDAGDEPLRWVVVQR